MVAGLAEAPPTSSARAPLLTLLAATVTVVVWASAFVAIRYAGREVSAGALSLGRLVVGSVVLGAFLLFQRQRRWPSRRDWGGLLVVGVAWFGIYNVTLNEAERHLDAGIAAMLVNVGPILIAVLAGLVLHEGFPRGLFAGSVVAFAGVIVIGISSSTGVRADAVGVVLCITAAVAYSCGVVAQKPLLGRLSALTVTWLGCTIGMIVCLPFAPALVHDLGHAQGSTVALIVYLGAFPTALAFTTWAYALSRTTAGKMGATTYVVPPLAILMGWAMLGEQPALLAVAGGVLCLTGVGLTRRLGRSTPG